jgi:hypothetical protein
VGGFEAELVSALAFGERHRIAQPDDACVGREDRLDHEGARDIAALDAELAGRADRPVPGVRVEDPREDRRAVVARQAEPVDRPVVGDERR